MNLEIRRPVWIALSDLYVDTELQDYEIRHIASVFKKSPYTLQEIWEVNKQEVFPVLNSNLITPIGVWTGFKEEWLVSEITKKIQKNGPLRKMGRSFSFYIFRNHFKEDWIKLEKEYEKLEATD